MTVTSDSYRLNSVDKLKLRETVFSVYAQVNGDDRLVFLPSIRRLFQSRLSCTLGRDVFANAYLYHAFGELQICPITAKVDQFTGDLYRHRPRLVASSVHCSL